MILWRYLIFYNNNYCMLLGYNKSGLQCLSYSVFNLIETFDKKNVISMQYQYEYQDMISIKCKTVYTSL